MKIWSALSLAVLLTASLLSPSNGQQYDQGDQGYGDQGYGDQDNFEQDNLYADYAARQQEKDVGAGGYVPLNYVTLRNTACAPYNLEWKTIVAILHCTELGAVL
jgi:hypothetical protein